MIQSEESDTNSLSHGYKEESDSFWNVVFSLIVYLLLTRYPYTNKPLASSASLPAASTSFVKQFHDTVSVGSLSFCLEYRLIIFRRRLLLRSSQCHSTLGIRASRRATLKVWALFLWNLFKHSQINWCLRPLHKSRWAELQKGPRSLRIPLC